MCPRSSCFKVRRAQAAITKGLEAKDAAEKERLQKLSKELKGQDYTYDHKGEVCGVTHVTHVAHVTQSLSVKFSPCQVELPLILNYRGSIGSIDWSVVGWFWYGWLSTNHP